VCIVGYVSDGTNNHIILAKIPLDGGNTGTYTVGAYSFIYTESTASDSTTNSSPSGLGFANSTATLVGSDASLPSSVSTLTSVTTALA
jgi:hypothetical protein